MQAHVYILASKRNGTLYVGVTTNLASRIAAHKRRLVPGFTKRYGVSILVHLEPYASILEARRRERRRSLAGVQESHSAACSDWTPDRLLRSRPGNVG